MLEQQQAWLVHGLQELYRCSIEGKGWSSKHLKLHSNSHQPIHDLLMRLGALNGTKGENFEENLETLQHNLRRSSNEMQRHESSDSGSKTPQLPVTRSHFPSNELSQNTMPPTPQTYSTSTHPPFKTKLQIPSTPQFVQPMSMHGVINPLALHGTQQWPINGFNTFDEIGLVYTTDYPNLDFEDQQLFSPIFDRQVSTNYVPQEPRLYSKTDYRDFNQPLNPNYMGITST
ncbi:hypothetical protein CBS147330_9818 [Penicillium roqueforti]|nr:hypothetical protein CBS147330_9818 [Penicillium roqueforti]